MNNINPDSILSLEFDYIKDTAHQANEDRLKILNFYIAITTGVITLSLGILSLGASIEITSLIPMFGLLAFMMAFVGWIFLAMMVRLRQAWHESISAMAKIKSYYIGIYPNIDQAFLWKQSSQPKPQRLWNIHFFSSSLVNFISSIFLGLSFGLILYSEVGISRAIIISIIIGVISWIVETLIYYLALSKNL